MEEIGIICWGQTMMQAASAYTEAINCIMEKSKLLPRKAKKKMRKESNLLKSMAHTHFAEYYGW